MTDNQQLKLTTKPLHHQYHRIKPSTSRKKPRWPLICITPFVCLIIILLIYRLLLSISNTTNQQKKYIQVQPAEHALKNLTKTTPVASLNVLLFSSPSLDPERPLNRFLSFLEPLPTYSLVIVCSPASQCPQPAAHQLIPSLSTYAPALTADSILVLDGDSLPYGLDRLWLATAAELALSRARIVTAVGASPTTLPHAMACISRPGPASLPLPPFLLPTRRWPTANPSIQNISQPLSLSFLLATRLRWPSLVLPLPNSTPDYYYLTQICHNSIRELSQIRLASLNQNQNNQNQNHDRNQEEINEHVDQILQAHLQPSVGILITEPDLDELETPSHDELIDWLTMACKLIEKFDAEIYLVSPSDQDGNEGPEDQQQLEEILKARMKSCSRSPHLIIHLLKPPSYTSSATRHPHSTLHTRINQLINSQPSLELMFYRLTTDNPLSLPHHFFKNLSDHQPQQQNSNDQKDSDNDQCVLIGLPSHEIMAADWILGLELQALKKWHKPKIDISVITNDRSRSLSRLLGSLERAAYYGDEVNIVINMEQTADRETRKLVEEFQWKQGSKTVRKRIIQGGLLPAVVESWYPSSAHDSYGVLLEDDVEVSGYFYGWLKFALLWYRYSGRAAGSIYGISLYQPQHSELRPEGRRPFNAPGLLAALGVEPSTMPYGSQVPCSWGALFFPETWVAFERYLTFRLANKLPGLRLDQPVIPSPIRSNRWPKSWKKYLIEWVYLRGQVMIYPNYHQLLSPAPSDPIMANPTKQTDDLEPTLVPTGLSTNHLEIGTHVHNRAYRAGKATHQTKRSLYEQHQRGKLRLMKWDETGTFSSSRSSSSDGSKNGDMMQEQERKAAQIKREFAIALKPVSRGSSLLDGLTAGRVGGRLPSLEQLTVFDLWAEPASLLLLRQRGRFVAIGAPFCLPFYRLLSRHQLLVAHSDSPLLPSDPLQLLASICR